MAEQTGLDIVRLLRHGNHRWLAAVRLREGHFHVAIDPLTLEIVRDRGCFSSCMEGTYGPFIPDADAEDGREWWTEYMATYDG